MDDLISRADAIEVADAVWSVTGDKNVAKVWDQLRNLPSAQRKGKWMGTQEWGGRNYSCSCCRFSFIVDTCMLEPMWNFCPNCGAMMEGSANE